MIHGTWQQTGGGGGDGGIVKLIGMAIAAYAAIMVASAAAAAIAALLWVIVTVAAVLAVAVVAAVVLRVRYVRRHPEAHPIRVIPQPVFHGEQRQAVKATQAPAIENHYHVHHHYGDREPGAEILRRQQAPE